jgi:hypothetical protein
MMPFAPASTIVARGVDGQIMKGMFVSRNSCPLSKPLPVLVHPGWLPTKVKRS